MYIPGMIPYPIVKKGEESCQRNIKNMSEKSHPPISSGSIQELGMDEQQAGGFCSLALIALSVLLTGFHVYSKLVTFAGAGALVPITGFANSVAAPAIEFKKEGWVFGVGCKIFTIAGPVILYGIFTSWVLGIIYWLRGILF